MNGSCNKRKCKNHSQTTYFCYFLLRFKNFSNQELVGTYCKEVPNNDAILNTILNRGLFFKKKMQTISNGAKDIQRRYKQLIGLLRNYKF